MNIVGRVACSTAGRCLHGRALHWETALYPGGLPSRTPGAGDTGNINADDADSGAQLPHQLVQVRRQTMLGKIKQSLPRHRLK